MSSSFKKNRAGKNKKTVAASSSPGISNRALRLYEAICAGGKAGDKPEVLSALTAADAAALQEIADNYAEQLAPELAMDVYRKLCLLDSQNPEAHIRLGQVLIKMGRFEEAQAELQLLVVLQPDNFHYRFALANVLMAQHKWQQAQMVVMGLRHKYPQHKAQVEELVALIEQQTAPPLKASMAETPAKAPAEPATSALPDSMPAALAGQAGTARKEIKILLCCLPGLDNFVDDVIAGLAPQIQLMKCVNNNLDFMVSQISRHDIIWLEWGDQLAEALTQKFADLLQAKKVILRIHSYEVYDDLAAKINFKVVDELVFVAQHICDLFLQQKPDTEQLVKNISIVPNGLVLENYFVPLDKQYNKNIAYMGYINYKKDPMLFLNAFMALLKRDPEYKLYLAGQYQDIRTQMAVEHFININGLVNTVVFDGWQKNVTQWFADKSYIIQSSLAESQGVAVMEGMLCGLKPLIYNFPGAENIFLRDFLWNNIDEFISLARQPIEPETYVRFVEENYSLAQQLEHLRRIIYRLV